ncbi:GNAT family N-acetyltransferase [Acidobacteria bacterium AH-259-L09]|nr:GNAT family N-acetyltransferase [Acidobacteria bacterium AH-259-L09]
MSPGRVDLKNHKLLTGRMVRLREVSFDDIDDIITWRNDPELGRYLNAFEKLTHQMQYDFLKHYFEKSDEYYFVAETLRTKQKVGAISVYHIDPREKRAEFGRLVMPEQYRIFAFEVAFLGLRFAFEVLGLDKVFGYAVEENERVLKFDLSLGLQRIRTLPQYWHNPRDGRKYDMILLEMGKEEYLKTKKRYEALLGGGHA